MILRDYWYKNAMIYCLDVETFMDSNGDGVGDFEGLISRLDELAGLGITCIWLLPFYPSPNRDNGFDVMDYYSVDPRLGTLGDFVEFTTRAKEYGIRILIDLVVNHTSIDHPWFQASRSDPNSRYRDYYVWKDEKPEDADEGMIFPGHQETTWTYDRKAKAYYFHRFYEHQPDLNIANPDVREEIRKIMMFWLQIGVSGFRVDAAPFIVEMRGIEGYDIADPYDYLRDFRQLLSWRRGDSILLAEANVKLKNVPKYFGNGDKLHMLFHFTLNQQIYLSLVRGDAKPVIDALKAAKDIPDSSQWAIFLRNHDELSLDKLTKAERQEVFEAMGPDENMQIYERGLRRRLAPLLDNDRRCLELAYSLMFTLPGTPVLYYGDEIGMGEDLSLPERNSVRTPMQWSHERNAGFSDADPDELIHPVIDKGDFSYEKVNFLGQLQDENSLLNWLKKVIQARKSCPEFGYGQWEIIETDQPSVVAHRSTWDNGVVIAVHNLADKKVKCKLDFNGDKIDHVVDILGDHIYEPQDQTHHVELDGYGYRWLRIEKVKDMKRKK